MKNDARLPQALRWSALLLVIAGLAVWLGTGARVGWTQTSVVTQQHDEITGIDYPVRQPGFVAGIEVPLAGAAAAATLMAASLASRRHRQRTA